MKELVKAAIKSSVGRLPWGANEALFEALLARMGGAELLARCMPKIDYLHLCADGEYGLIQSALSDGLLLPDYGRTGVYEPRMAKLFHDFFEYSGGGTYVDIGANIGLTTIPVARDPRIACLAFEPEPNNFYNLQSNVRRNCVHQNVEVHKVAIYKESTVLAFDINDTNLGGHRISSDQARKVDVVEVHAEPLDRFDANIKGSVAVKIDTEGAEPFVIAGGSRVLSRASIVVLEFCPNHMQTIGSDPDVIFEFLSDFHAIGVASRKGDDLPKPIPATEALSHLRDQASLLRHGDNNYWDVFAFREDCGDFLENASRRGTHASGDLHP